MCIFMNNFEKNFSFAPIHFATYATILLLHITIETKIIIFPQSSSLISIQLE